MPNVKGGKTRATSPENFSRGQEPSPRKKFVSDARGPIRGRTFGTFGKPRKLSKCQAIFCRISHSADLPDVCRYSAGANRCSLREPGADVSRRRGVLARNRLDLSASP